MSLSLILGVAVEVFVPLYYKEIFDLFVESSELNKAQFASEMFEIVKHIAYLFLFLFISWRVNEFSNNYFQTSIMRNIANECFEFLNRHSFRFFSDHFSGSLVRKVNRLVRAFENFADRIYWDFTALIVRIISMTVVIYVFSPLLAGIILAWIIVFIFISYILAKWKYPLDIISNKADSQISAVLADVISNNLNVKLFNSHNFELENFRVKSEDQRIKAKRAWDFSSKVNAFQGAFMITLELLIISVTIYLWRENLVTPGFFVLIQAYLIHLFTRIWDFRRVIQDLFWAFANAEEMMEILTTEPEIKSVKNAEKINIQRGEVEFKKVSFEYSSGQKVLNNFNLKISPGEKIALVGHSGEGKTTIAKLLIRLFDIQKGEILFDEQNIAMAEIDSVRGSISLVPQDPALFHRSLFDNIRYGKKNASKKEVIAASKLANCHEFILRTKYKYNTMVGERGVKLSGGERQRIAIARAILEDAHIIILDEATSSLDSYSEKLIQQALHRLLKGKTAIMIAHRLSTIMEADRILVMKNGKISESGTHQSLLKKKGGMYRHLWEIQAGGFIGE